MIIISNKKSEDEISSIVGSYWLKIVPLWFQFIEWMLVTSVLLVAAIKFDKFGIRVVAIISSFLVLLYYLRLFLEIIERKFSKIKKYFCKVLFSLMMGIFFHWYLEFIMYILSEFKMINQ